MPAYAGKSLFSAMICVLLSIGFVHIAGVSCVFTHLGGRPSAAGFVGRSMITMFCTPPELVNTAIRHIERLATLVTSVPRRFRIPRCIDSAMRGVYYSGGGVLAKNPPPTDRPFHAPAVNAEERVLAAWQPMFAGVTGNGDGFFAGSSGDASD